MANNADYVYMAHNIYKDKELRAAPEGWKLHSVFGDQVASGLQAQAYINETTKEIVFAFAGTNGLSDIPPDIDFVTSMFGGYDPQFRDAVTYVNTQLEALQDEYPGYTFSTTGHSLGGGLSQIISHTYGWGGGVL